MLECGTTVTTAPASISQLSSAAGTGPGPSRSIRASPELQLTIFLELTSIYQIPVILLMHLDRVNSRNCLHDRQVLEVRHVAPV